MRDSPLWTDSTLTAAAGLHSLPLSMDAKRRRFEECAVLRRGEPSKSAAKRGKVRVIVTSGASKNTCRWLLLPVRDCSLLDCLKVLARKKARLDAAALLLAMVVTFCGCGHWNGEAEYHPPRGLWSRSKAGAVSFGIGLPGEGWRPYPEKESGVQVAWLSQAHSSVIQVRSQCAEHGDSSLEMFTEHIGADFGDWKVRQIDTGERDHRNQPVLQEVQEHFRLAGRQALRSTIDAELDGVEVCLEVVVIKKDGCLFDLTLIAPPKHFDGCMKAFDRVVKGFRFPLRSGKGSS